MKNVLLVLVSIVLSAIAAEGLVRALDGYPMLALPLGDPTGSSAVRTEALDKVPRAAGVDREWFFSDPAPLPNRRPVPEEWRQLFRHVEDHPSGGKDFRPPDALRAWNSAFAGDPCKHPFLRHAPGQLFLYDPADGARTPPYRFQPNATLPNGLVTNQIGWRGAPIEAPRGNKTIRIVFVGASTTLDLPNLPFSYTEFVGHWLNQWAKSKGLAVHFEVLNAARESIVSTDTAAIVRTEVVPLRPDMVVYHEGGNQFRPASIVPDVPAGSAVRPPAAQATAAPWLQSAARYSALFARLRAGLAAADAGLDGREWPKPDYRVAWPEGLDEFDPDLSYPRLPVSLNLIQRDLDSMRTDLAAVGSELAVSSFLWMVKDGMVLDPIRHRYILEQLNVSNYPFRYRDLERLAAFQNRVLAKYASVHGLAFVDMAGPMPMDPDLFLDAVHANYAGIRLKGWVAFNQLLPAVEKRLAAGVWPRPPPADAPSLPTFTPRRIKLACD